MIFTDHIGGRHEILDRPLPRLYYNIKTELYCIIVGFTSFTDRGGNPRYRFELRTFDGEAQFPNTADYSYTQVFEDLTKDNVLRNWVCPMVCSVRAINYFNILYSNQDN